VLVVSGIARPERFVAETVAGGFDVAGDLAFGDHHPFVAADVARIALQARSSGASIVLTTEKDLIRLLPLRPWPFRLAVRPMSVRVEPAEAFAAWLLPRIRSAGMSVPQSDDVSRSAASASQGHA
jgi:tetraacyldisaccharide 4'-kinase